MPPDIQIFQALAASGPSVLLIAAVVFLWRYIVQKDSESIERGKARDARIATLEAAQDAHADKYRDLAEKVTTIVAQTKDVMDQTKDVMVKVLEKLK